MFVSFYPYMIYECYDFDVILLYAFFLNPIRHVEVTDHVFVLLYPYAIYGYSLDLSLLVISTISLISVDSYVFLLFPLSSTSYPYDWGYMHFHCDGHMPASPP